MKIVRPRDWFNLHSISFFSVAVCACTVLFLQASDHLSPTTGVGLGAETSLVLEFRLSFGKLFQGSKLSGSVSVEKDDSYKHVRDLAVDIFVNKGLLDRSFVRSFKFKTDEGESLFSGSGIVDEPLIARLREYKDSGRELYAVVNFNHDE